MFVSFGLRYLIALILSSMFIFFPARPVGAEDLVERVVRVSHCHGGLSALSEHHPMAEARTLFKGYADGLESIGPLYVELGELDVQISKDAGITGYREVTDIVNAKDQNAYTAFLEPCIALLLDLPSYEIEVVTVADMLALIGIGEPAEPRQFLLDHPDSVFAPILRKKLEELK